MVRNVVNYDRNRNFRAQVEKAIREHKIFTCVGAYPAVRKALVKRGWVEKSTNPNANVNAKPETRGFGKDYDDESDQAWMNRVLKDYPPDFVWTIRRDNIDWRGLHRDQIINRYPKASFTTKVGIASCLQTMQWFSEDGVSDTLFPRCYRLCVEEEKDAFIDDYRLSACMGLLKWVVQSYDKEGESGVMDQTSSVASLVVDFAVRQVNTYIRTRRHEDIDWLIPSASTAAFMGLEHHWDVFLTQYYNVVFLKTKLAPTDNQDTAKLKYEACKRTLQRLSPYWPQLHIDGTLNIWICKPGARSQGKGIVIMNQLDKILDLLAQSTCVEANWVVQKYIERPLLIYKTKFDIRQWFIVTDWSPLTVWFYRESYIRFCTKPFDLSDFHESIHLSNNAIQCRYENSNARDTALPDENMWDCYTFQAYLKTLGKMDLWESQIYPGMKQGILGVLLASQESTDNRKNCFELYGADFMLSEDLQPWLIEINSCPCMAPSTSVTARMCAQCLEDSIKVIIDKKEDKYAETGMFELIYKQNNFSIPTHPFNGVELIVQGKKLARDVDWPGLMSKYNSKRGSSSSRNAKMRRDSRQLLKQCPNPPFMHNHNHSHGHRNGINFTELVERLRQRDPKLPESRLMIKSPPIKLISESNTDALNNNSIIDTNNDSNNEETNSNKENNNNANNKIINNNEVDNTSLAHNLKPLLLLSPKKLVKESWSEMEKQGVKNEIIAADPVYKPFERFNEDQNKITCRLKHNGKHRNKLKSLKATHLRQIESNLAMRPNARTNSISKNNDNNHGIPLKTMFALDPPKTSMPMPIPIPPQLPTTNQNQNQNQDQSQAEDSKSKKESTIKENKTKLEREELKENKFEYQYGKLPSLSLSLSALYDIHKINTGQTRNDISKVSPTPPFFNHQTCTTNINNIDNNNSSTNNDYSYDNFPDQANTNSSSTYSIISDDDIDDNDIVDNGDSNSNFDDNDDNVNDNDNDNDDDNNNSDSIHGDGVQIYMECPEPISTSDQDNLLNSHSNSSSTTDPESNFVECKSEPEPGSGSGSGAEGECDKDKETRRKETECESEIGKGDEGDLELPVKYVNVGFAIKKSPLYKSVKTSAMKREGPSPLISHARPHPCHRLALDKHDKSPHYLSKQSSLVASKKYLSVQPLPLKRVSINWM